MLSVRISEWLMSFVCPGISVTTYSISDTMLSLPHWRHRVSFSTIGLALWLIDYDYSCLQTALYMWCYSTAFMIVSFPTVNFWNIYDDVSSLWAFLTFFCQYSPFICYMPPNLHLGLLSMSSLVSWNGNTAATSQMMLLSISFSKRALSLSLSLLRKQETLRFVS